MSTLPAASALYNEELPPGVAGDNAVTATDTTNSAASLNLAVTTRGCFVTFQPIGGDVFVRFGSSATTATTTATGVKIADGTMKRFWITSANTFVDHICSTSAKKLLWWKSSRLGA